MRGIMIVAGAALISRFHWIIYVFGVLLMVTAVKMMFAGEEKVEPDRNILVRLARKLYPVSKKMEGQQFFTHVDGKRAHHPRCSSACWSLRAPTCSSPSTRSRRSSRSPWTRSSFFTSNIFAILCLRSLYFALAGLMHKFRYLKTSLVFLLAYIGVKMLLTDVYEIPTGLSAGDQSAVHWSWASRPSLLGEHKPAPARPYITTNRTIRGRMRDRGGGAVCCVFDLRARLSVGPW